MLEQQAAPVVASAVAATTITKYYYFNGQRVSMRTNASGPWLHYDLHTDHLGSTVLTTNQGGVVISNQRYYAYGRTRYGNISITDQRFTGQKQDSTGLQYYNARYYDPDLGQFLRGLLGADTLVPDPGHLYAYNLYLSIYLSIYMDSVFRVMHTASAQTPVRRARQSATSHLRWRRCQE